MYEPCRIGAVICTASRPWLSTSLSALYNCPEAQLRVDRVTRPGGPFLCDEGSAGAFRPEGGANMNKRKKVAIHKHRIREKKLEERRKASRPAVASGRMT